MTDEELIARLRNYGHVGTVLEAADRIEALVEERDQWVEHTKNAVWSDSEELKLANARAERLEKLVKEAFYEGFSEGRDGGWVWGNPSPAWKMSSAKKEMT